MKRVFNRLIMIGEGAGAAAIAMIAAVVLYDVFARALGYPTLWSLEVCSYLMIAASVLAAGEVLQQGGHFEVRLFVEMLPPVVQRVLDAVVTIISALFVLAVTYGIFQLLMQTAKFGFKSPTLLQVPLIYPQGILAVGFILLTFAYIAKTIVAIRGIRGEQRAA